MKKRKKRALALMACAAVAAGITGIAFWMFGQTAPHSQTLSVGMQHLADEAYVAISAPAGESICFSNEWFDKSLGGAKVSAITVTALPDVTKGTLKLGYGEVSVGQVIQRENFPYLTFTPTALSLCREPPQGMRAMRFAAGFALLRRRIVARSVPDRSPRSPRMRPSHCRER